MNKHWFRQLPEAEQQKVYAWANDIELNTKFFLLKNSWVDKYELEERVAICMMDGHLSLEDAELIAIQQVLNG